MAIPRAGEKCCIHLVRFAKIEEFPDEEPDLDGVLSSFKAGRCQRNVLDREGNYLRVPLCSEDMEETDDPHLFDGEGYLVRVCPQHAAWLNTHAVEHRACSGALCGHALPLAARCSVGKRLFCGACKDDFELTQRQTGKTPARPDRSLKPAPASASSADSWSNASGSSPPADNTASSGVGKFMGPQTAMKLSQVTNRVFGLAERAAEIVAPKPATSARRSSTSAVVQSTSESTTAAPSPRCRRRG